MSEAAICTTCPYCGVGCGVKARVEAEQLAPVQGDAEHPANWGRLCVKGSSLHESVGLQGRLLHPMIRGQRASWDDALALIASRFSEIRQRKGPDALALYLSGQLLSEDYYVANKLMKGFIGSANVDTNSRLCMSSTVAGYKRALGADAVPGCYEDIEACELAVIVGSNMAWAHPILYQRLAAAKAERGIKVVVIDPRQTATCDLADLHLPLRPDADIWLFNGLLAYLVANQAIDQSFIDQHLQGYGELLASLHQQDYSLAQVSRATDLSEADLLAFYQLFAAHPRTLTLFSQGTNQSERGTDKVSAILNVHLLTGRIGKPGASPFSLTGQPNAMGGREVGGLANQLAAHMDFYHEEDIARVARFWQAPNMATRPGLKAVDMFRAVASGQIEAIWIMGTNPAVSLPEANLVRLALQKCPLVIVSEAVADSDTARLATVLLPAQTWGEKSGMVTNSERRLSRQRPLLPAPGEAKADWWMLTQVAQRMGWSQAFAYQHPLHIFREHAALSGLDNQGTRAFDISALAEMTEEQYESFRPLQWPINAAYPQGKARLFEDGRFFHVNGRAQLTPVQPGPQQLQHSPAYPHWMNTGRIRDQWHTMTRTGRVPRLLQHLDEPFVALHPEDAEHLHLQEGQLAKVSSSQAELCVRVRLDSGQRPGQVFVPMHWSDAFAAQARVDSLVAARLDPLSGQPAFKATPVRISPWQADWHGLCLSREELHWPALAYWSRVPLTAGWRYRLAGQGDWLELPALLEQRYGQPTQRIQGPTGLRLAWFVDGRLTALLILGQQEPAYQLEWLQQQLGQPLQASERLRILAGLSVTQEDKGPLVCSCYQVGQKQIEAALAQGQADSVATLGQQLKCGTNCGSCIPELRKLVAACGSAQAEEAA
ncbi:nitrate reductase [Balneatrix alpica]|uniref:nitrate reductase n=1 Tax=Balneatrix alpica TaxID=75684 RepID=UPI0027393D41|nr:nitrate reductase [Balneatrix alpica]